MEFDNGTNLHKEEDLKSLFPKLLDNLNDLKNTRPFSNGLSFREFFGLSIITAFRKHTESTKDWFFTTDKNISDDGAISYSEITRHDIDYPHEKIEQVYLPIFFERNNAEHYEDLLIRFLENKKLNKDSSYKNNKSLVLLNDIDTMQGFNWVNVLQKIFPKNKTNYSHFYYIGYMGQNDDLLSYILLSYTDKPYRSYLNGQFKFFLYKNGEYKFKRIQDIEVDDIWNINI